MYISLVSPIILASTVSPAPPAYAVNAAFILVCCAVVNAVLPYTGVGAAGAVNEYQAPGTG